MRVPKHICGIIGWPLGHTLSPVLHNWAFERLGVDMAYAAFPTPPERLAAVVAAVRALPIRGLSVTIPHKLAVMELLDEVLPAARAVGAVNTLFWDGGRLCGENTDVEGFSAPLAGRSLGSALVLGAGGAARAALAGLRGLGVARVALTARDPAKAAALAADFGCDAVAWGERADAPAELLVNTTPLGMSGAHAEASPWPAEAFRAGRAGVQVAYDLVYNPLETRFLREARAAGCATILGLEMFLGQAAGQFRRWTGLELPLAGARELLTATLRG